VRAYSGINGTGSMLGSFNLLANASHFYDVWTRVTFAFTGTAHSFDWTGSARARAEHGVADAAGWRRGAAPGHASRQDRLKTLRPAGLVHSPR